VCTQLFQPGVNAASFPTDFAAMTTTITGSLASAPHTSHEPPLKPYAATGD
jgi:hypothetical protein